MKYKVSALLLVFCFLIGTVQLCAVTAPKISAGNGEGKKGEIVEIPLSLSGNTGFSSLGIEIDYDSTALELTDVTENTSVGASFTKAQSYTAKPYNMSWNSAINNTHNGTLATLKFKILTDNADEYPISISFYKGRNGNYTDGYDVNYDENFSSLHLSYGNGKITVAGNGNADATAPTVTVGTVSGKKGDTVSLPVMLANNTGFSSLGIEIDYDTNALRLTDVSANANVGATFTKAQTLSTVPFNLGWSSAENNTFNGTLATLQFEILQNVSGAYPVSVSFYKGRNGNYTDGYDVNYDENFVSLNLKYISGTVTVTTAGGTSSPEIWINGKKVMLTSDIRIESTTMVLLAAYQNTELVGLEVFTGQNTVSATFTSGTYVKIFVWNSKHYLQPFCVPNTIPLQ